MDFNPPIMAWEAESQPEGIPLERLEVKDL